jgi:Ca2+-binding EF-hand superfamily protein
MLSVNEAIKILNKNEKKYTQEQTKNILNLLTQFGEIAYSQFKQNKGNEKSNTIRPSINR